MVTLVVGDPHLKLQRLEDNQKFLQALMDLLIKEDCEQLLLLGDLFDTFAVIRSEVLSLWNGFFSALARDNKKIKVVALVGNHDFASQRGGSHALEVFKDRVTVIDRVQKIGGVYFIPFIRGKDLFEQQARDLPKGSALVCHQSFLGAKFTSGYEDPDGADPKCVEHLNAVISGHIHTRQAIANVWYPGTPYQMNFGEAGDEKRVFTIDLHDAGYQILKEHDLGLPRFIQVETENVADLKLPPPHPEYCYKFVAKGSPAEIVSFWNDPAVKEFRSRVRRVVDALVPERGSVILPGSMGSTERDKLDDFIRSKKWRTPVDELSETAQEMLFEGNN